MLAYIVENGDQNIVLYECKKKGGKVTEEILDKETHKYDLYHCFDKIVFNECEIAESAEANNGGVIDIDWSQIDTGNFTIDSSEPT